VAKNGCILSKRKLKLIAPITLATCFQTKTAIACCPPDSSSSRTARQHTQHAVGQLSTFHHKGPVPPNSPDITQWTITCQVQCWRLTASLKQSRKHSPNSRKSGFRLSGATSHRDRLTFDKAVKDFSKRLKACVVLELVADSSNIHSDNT